MSNEDFSDEDKGPGVPADHIGIELKRRRVELGNELADIAHQTRIPMRHLTAIEDGLHDNLPALPYTIGFVKSYARFVGMDPDEASERFRAETTKSDRVVPTMINEPIDDGRVPSFPAALVGIVLLVVVALGVFAYSMGWFSDEESAESAEIIAVPSPVVAVPPPVTDTAVTETVVAAADATNPVVPVGGKIVIAAREDAWVKVYEKGSGKSVFMGVMAAGDRYEVPAVRTDLLLWTGRAGALDISVGGTAVPALGALTETARDVPLTAEGLAARTKRQGR